MKNLGICISFTIFLTFDSLTLGDLPTKKTLSLGLAVQKGVLVKDGQPYQGIGVNYFNLFLRRLQDNADISYRHSLRQLSEANIPFVRFACCGFWPVNWDLYLKDKDAYFALLDDVVKEAEKSHIGLIPSLFWHIPVVPDLVGEHMDQLGEPNSKSIAFIKCYAEEIVTRYKNSPAIWCWEFVNEFNLHVDLPNADTHRPHIVPSMGTPTTRSARDEFSSKHMLVAFQQFAQTVRKYDKHRIITTGNSIPRPCAYHNTKENSWKADSIEQFAEILLRDNPDPFDTISIHVYPREPEEIYSAGANDLPGLIATANRYARKFGKPLFIGEFGASNKYGKDVERSTFEKIITAIETNQIPLSALWVFDFPQQDKDWNITFDNDRTYMLHLIAEANRRMQKRLKK